jgi:REP element-mobilizing transposase RayT
MLRLFIFVAFATFIETYRFMPTGYQINNQEALYFLTIQVVHWADIFTRQVYRDIVVESLSFCRQNKGLELFAYVIMSNHIHMLVRSRNGTLSDTIRDFKRHTSKKIVACINEQAESRREWLLMIFRYAARQHKRNNEYQLWTHENHAIELENAKVTEQRINYIHENPVRAGIVANAEDYLYSSARNYSEMDSILEIDKING